MALGTIGKVAVAAALFCGVAAVGAFVTKADRDPRPAPQTITEFGGVALGMSPTDVTLALGKPFASSKIETDGEGRAHLIYVYSKGKNDDHSLDVTFHGANSTLMRAAVVCEQGGFANLLGFDKFSREQDILRVLGNPVFTSIRGDGLEKTISYSQWNASFKIALGNVTALCIHQGDFIQYDKEVSPGAPTPAI